METDKQILGISIGCFTWIAFLVVLIVGGAIFEIWYNNTLAVPVQNSERNVATCSQQYLVSQKSRIENDLQAIAENNTQLAQTKDSNLQLALQGQNKASANDVYNSLDASQCSHSQILQDMPELQNFFQQFPTRG